MDIGNSLPSTILVLLQFGELSEVNILKRADGKMVGCAFIQYKNANNAAKVSDFSV